MKKLLIAFVALSLAVIFVAADESFLYLDGNARVGREGDLPKGLFVKASGYLPGDNVSITNSLNGETVELLNLGSVDSSSGSIMLLSKEAAEGLGISPDSSLKIKLSSRKGSFDQSAAGVGIVSSVNPGDAAYGVPVAKKFTAPVESYPEDEAAEEPLASGYTEAVYESVPLDADGADASEGVAVGGELPDEDEYYEEEVAALEPLSGAELSHADLVPSEYTAPVESVAEKVEVVEEQPALDSHDSSGEKIGVLEPVKEDEPSAFAAEGLDSDFDGEDVAFEEPLGSEYVPKDSVLKPADSSLLLADAGLEAADADAIEEAAEEALEEDAELVDDISEPVAIVIPVNPDAGPEADFAGEEIVAAEPSEIKEEPVAAFDLSDPDEDKVEEEVASVEPVESVPEEPYSPIVLVPSEDVTPPKPEKKEEKPAVVKVEVKPQTPPAPTGDIASRLRKESDLDRSRYYIQIATLSENSSAQSLIDRYGKYPLVMIQNPRGAYRVLVGPLSVDEYGMILERFKGYGFKDSFVKYPGTL